MSDSISRQAAISAICNACGKIDCDKTDKCEKLQLSPANISETPNSSDTISRQQAIDALNEYFARIGKLKRRGLTKGEKAISLDTVGTIKTLPPAEPKRGKWVLVCDNNGMHFICNKCGAWRYHQEQKFCGECGADMREVTT